MIYLSFGLGIASLSLLVSIFLLVTCAEKRTRVADFYIAWTVVSGVIACTLLGTVLICYYRARNGSGPQEQTSIDSGAASGKYLMINFRCDMY
jgi:hypothetical protein